MVWFLTDLSSQISKIKVLFSNYQYLITKPSRISHIVLVFLLLTFLLKLKKELISLKHRIFTVVIQLHFCSTCYYSQKMLISAKKSCYVQHIDICLIDCFRRLVNLEILGNWVIFENLRSPEKPTLHKVNQVDAVSVNKLEEIQNNRHNHYTENLIKTILNIYVFILTNEKGRKMATLAICTFKLLDIIPWESYLCLQIITKIQKDRER